jgi:transcription elongation factor Elf1
MKKEVSKGRCYICGSEFSTIRMKNHIIKAHSIVAGAHQECLLVKVEGAYDKNYWLYLDLPVESNLSSLDGFLRRIWLECCGHMSAFYIKHYDEISMARKISKIEIGQKINYDYDFGSTTSLVITTMDKIQRPKQKETIRLLARNIPPLFKCAECGEKADYICVECNYETDNSHYCENCSEDHEHEEMLLPVTNSPRMGVCGYTGEYDDYGFEMTK